MPALTPRPSPDSLSSTSFPTAAAVWLPALDTLLARLASRFSRSEVRTHVRASLTGLLSPVARKNSGPLAEQAGDRTPYALQHLLGRAQWDADAVRDDLQAYVRTHLADPDALLVIDETSFLKKGTHSVGVGLQYSGITGHIENCQVGVFLVYAAAQGQTFYDRALYLPKEWTDDAARRRQAGVPDAVRFATKPAMAQRMVERALDDGLPVGWVVGDEVYGNAGTLRHALEERRPRYALTVGAGPSVIVGWTQQRVRALIASLPAEAWECLSAGEGTKGPRLYDWARLRVNNAVAPGWERWIVARRSLTAPDDPRSLAYIMVCAPATTPLEEIARVSGRRWTIEQCFADSKGEVGLDQYEVRSWQGWHRHITLVLLAHAFLAVQRLPLSSSATAPVAEKKGGLARARSLQAFKATRGL